MVDRSRCQQRRDAIETGAPPASKAHRRWCSERDAENMLEHWPVSMPADTGAWVVADQEGLDELVRLQVGEPRRLRTHRQQPIGNCLGRREAGVVEIIPPTVGGSESLPEPSMKAEGREFGRVDRRYQHPLLVRCDERPGLGQPDRACFIKQIGLGGGDAVHACGALSPQAMWDAAAGWKSAASGCPPPAVS